MPDNDVRDLLNVPFQTFFGVAPFGGTPPNIDPHTGRPPGVPSAGDPDPFAPEAGDYLLGVFDNRADKPGQSLVRKKIFESPFQLLIPGRFVKAGTEVLTGEIPGDDRTARGTNGTSERTGEAERNDALRAQAAAQARGAKLVPILVTEGLYLALPPAVRAQLYPWRAGNPKPTLPPTLASLTGGAAAVAMGSFSPAAVSAVADSGIRNGAAQKGVGKQLVHERADP